MRFANEQKEEVKARVDLADLISSYGNEVRHNGSGIWCRCPFHNEKTPSMKIDPSTGWYHCFGCGESGDAIDFVMKQDGLSFGEALKKLADKVGIELKSSVVDKGEAMRGRLLAMMSELAIDFGKMLKAEKFAEADLARKYVDERGLSGDAVSKFMIGYVPKDVDKLLGWAKRHGYSEQDLVDGGILKARRSQGDRPYSYFGGRLVFAVKDKYGKVIAFSGRKLDESVGGGKYVNSPETILFKKSRTMFAFDEARRNIVKAPNREAIVCEGQIDCIRLHVSGFPTAVAPLGTAFTEEHAVMLHRVADTALLCFDDDAAGHKATVKAASILLAEGIPVRVVSLPDGDDPDSFIRTKGADAFAKLVEDRAESIVRYQVRAERAKEASPDDPNATDRVAKAVMSTIAACKSKVMREALLKEAAKELDIKYSVMSEDIDKVAKLSDDAGGFDPESLIEKPIDGRAEDLMNLPGNAEGAFIVFLMENEGKMDDDKPIVKALFPKEVFKSSLTSRFVDAWLEDKVEDNDPIRKFVETIPHDEYKNFISLMTSADGMAIFDEMDVKHKVVYFARQVWHEYFLRLIARLSKLDETDKTKDAMKKVCAYALSLNTGTVKGIVKLMRVFKHEEFAWAFEPQDAIAKE